MKLPIILALIITSSSLASSLSVSNEINYQKRYVNDQFQGQTLTVYNSSDYIDEELISAFEEEYGVKVNYYTFDTNETMYNQLTLQKEGTYD